MYHQQIRKHREYEERLGLTEVYLAYIIAEWFLKLETAWQLFIGLTTLTSPITNDMAEELLELIGPGHSSFHRELELVRTMSNMDAWNRFVDEITSQATSDMRTQMDYGFHVVSYNVTDSEKMVIEVISRMNQTPWSTYSWSDSLWRNQQMVAARVKELLPEVFKGRMTLDQAAENLSKLSNVAKHNAVRLLRTEGAAVITESQRELALQNGFHRFILIAVLDDRTSAVCEELNETYGYWDTARIGHELPPFHPHCRTIAVTIG